MRVFGRRTSRALGMISALTLALAGTAGPAVADSEQLPESASEQHASEIAPIEEVLDPDLPVFDPNWRPLMRSSSAVVGPVQGASPRTGQGYEWHHNIDGVSNHWLGAYSTGLGILEWCINLNSVAPTAAGNIVLSATPNARANQSGFTNAHMGYLLKTYGQVGGPGADAETRAALAYLIHMFYEQGSGDLYANALWNDISSRGGSVYDRAGQLNQEAQNSSVVGVAPGGVTTHEGKTRATLRDFGARNSRSQPLYGIPFTATINGPATFLNGTKTYSGTTALNLELELRSQGNGKVTVDFDFQPNWKLLQTSGRVGQQDTLSTSGETPEWMTVTTPEFDLVFNFQPVLSSAVATKFVAAGADFVDTIKMEAAEGDSWVVVNGAPVPAKVNTTLYYAGSTKPTATQTVPTSAVEVGSAPTTFTGPGSKTVVIPTDGRGGYYVAKTTFRIADQPSDLRVYFKAGATYDWGLANETTVAQVNPSISTKAVHRQLETGTNTADAVEVSLAKGQKWPTGMSLTAKGTRYGPFLAKPAPSNNAPSNARVDGTTTLTFAAPGTKNAQWTPSAGGYYTWVWEIDKGTQANPELLASGFKDRYGLADETSVSQITPSITTKASDKIVRPKQRTTDQVTINLKGNQTWIPGLTIHAKGTRYGPFDQPVKQATSVPAGAPVDGIASLEFTANKQTLNASWTPQKEGFYAWVWEIDKSVQSDPSLLTGGFKDNFMIHQETTVAQWEIQHSSLAREYNVAPGGRAFDQITVSGLSPTHGEYAGDSYWLADVKEARVVLYDAGEGRDWATQNSDIPNDATVHWEGTVEAKNGVFQIGYDDGDQLSGFSPGHDYVFVYFFEGDDRTEKMHSPFNDILERFHVPREGEELPPSVATQAQKKALVGEPFGDTALVMGRIPVGATLTFEAFGPQRNKTPKEKSTPLCATPFFTSAPIAVSGAGYFDSPKITVAEPGLVYWVETLRDKNGKTLHQGTCGVPSETTAVIPYQPSIATNARSDQAPNQTSGPAKLKVGAQIWDELTASWEMPPGFTGYEPSLTPWPFPAGSTTTVNLYWAETAETLTCENNPVHSFSPIKLVEGTTDYSTPRYTTNKPGAYTFVETTLDQEGRVVTQGQCGDPDETLTVQEIPPVAAKPSPPPEIPRTGASTWMLSAAGILLLVGALASTGAYLSWKKNSQS